MSNVRVMLARGARKEADSFEADIVLAKQQATDAESHLAEALQRLQRADVATVALDRIKSPRSIQNATELASALRKFKGTGYAFESVFQDPEAIGLLESIDSLLQLAEWTKVKGAPGFPGINVYGKDDGFPVVVGFGVGVFIRFSSSDSATMPTLPLEKQPPIALAAVALQRGLRDNLSPKATNDDVAQANVQPGDSRTIRITVGRKP